MSLFLYTHTTFSSSVHLLLPSVHTAVPRWLYDTALCKLQGSTHQDKLDISRVQPQERERIKTRDMEDWKDYVPKGRGVK